MIACFWAWREKCPKMFVAPQTTETKETPQKTHQKASKIHLAVLGSFRSFLEFQHSSRFVCVSVVLRFSQKHACLEQRESFFGLFDLSS